MATKAKKQKLSWKGSILTIAYPNIGKTFSADVSKYPKVIQEAARFHGFGQKFGDEKSGGTAAQKFAGVQEIHANLLASEWNRERGAVDPLPLICAAIARIKGKSLDIATNAVEAMSKEAQAGLRQRADVKHAIAKMREEKLALLVEEEEELEIPGL